MEYSLAGIKQICPGSISGTSTFIIIKNIVFEAVNIPYDKNKIYRGVTARRLLYGSKL